ncbi:putative 5'-nucleotidase domain-containing protein 3 [Apostichopus japonicus]|uniref:Putative 5'-nucleotidase domain-containing protein 3 n=1 Tax=Stichopus japonicus TaxID=307972 RepID=A0A2G8JMC0_STIJA|nr:putative 5'-nucleotidase domain-containing protein 3 [Apostichopus japonicus]
MAAPMRKTRFLSELFFHRSSIKYSLLQLRENSFNIYRSHGGNTSRNKNESDLWEEYSKHKDYCENFAKQAAESFAVDPKSVFANNEVDLSTIDVYGFDYDYTLACYTCELHHLIYKEALENLVDRRKFPPGIRDMKYNLNFGIRGLHFDTKKGLLMKIDAFHHIQLGTVYRGLQQLADSEVLDLYDGTHVPEGAIMSFNGQSYFKQLIDLFSIPEMTLLGNVTEYLEQRGIPYDSEYLFSDIHNAVKEVHFSGNMHKEVGNNVGAYLESSTEVRHLISRLHNKGKRLFLITNSPFEFVDKGMSYMIGNDWVDYFEVIVVQARKPLFFKDTTRPFRFIYPKTGTPAWSRVKELRKGEYYLEGNVEQFTKLTGWDGSRVLYFGDHIYSDLADPSLQNGWRTGGIIPELEASQLYCEMLVVKLEIRGYHTRTRGKPLLVECLLS